MIKYKINQSKLDALLDKYEKADNPKKSLFVDMDMSHLVIKNRVLSYIDMSRSDLTGCTISSCIFNEASFNGAVMNNCVIEKSAFVQCDMRLVSICESRIVDSEIVKSGLDGAHVCFSSIKALKLCQSSISGTDFSNSILDEVDFKQAHIGNTTVLIAEQLINCLNVFTLVPYFNDFGSKTSYLHQGMVGADERPYCVTKLKKILIKLAILKKKGKCQKLQ